MVVEHGNYKIELTNELNFTSFSMDNINSFKKVFPLDSDLYDRNYPSTKYGIRIYHHEDELASAILIETGGAGALEKKSFCFEGDNLLICCSDKVYSLELPELNLNWSKRLDWATCFAIFPFKEDFIIHGEMQIKRINKEGEIKWEFGARDIFVTPNGESSFKIEGNKILLTDFSGYKYELDENGKNWL